MTRQSKDQPTTAQLATAFLQHAATNADEDFWAYDRVGEIVRGPDAQAAWEICVGLVRAAPDEQLGYIGAGPIEDLVCRHGAALIEWLEGEAKRDSRFREALASIWLVADDIPREVLLRLQESTGGRILVHTRAEIDAANEGLSQSPRP